MFKAGDIIVYSVNGTLDFSNSTEIFLSVAIIVAVGVGAEHLRVKNLKGVTSLITAQYWRLATAFEIAKLRKMGYV